MKHRLICLLLLGALLAGCTPQPTQPSVSTSPTAPTVQTVPTEPGEVPDTLLDNAQPVGQAAGLLYVPNSHAESMAVPQMQLFGNALLLHEYQPGSDGGIMVLRLIRLEDGALMAEASLPTGGGCAVRAGNDTVALYDSDLGQVTILDSRLSVIKTYDLPYKGNLWYPDPALRSMYIFVADQGLLSLDLETGAERWIITRGAALSVKNADAAYLILEYTDKTDLRTHQKYLDLATGSLEDIPFTGPVSAAYRKGDTWLIRPLGFDGTYTVVHDNAAGSFRWAQASILTARGQLLLPEEDYRSLRLYNADGAFVSRCALADMPYATAGADFVWSDHWNGYFFTDTWDNAAHLMFWDIRSGETGTNLEITPPENDTPPAQTVDPAFYQQAEALSRQYGVNIRIAEQCLLNYTHYDAVALNDDHSITKALATLEQCLSRYPEGMLAQLTFGNCATLQIDLVGGLRAKEGADSHPALANGFVQDLGYGYLLVLDAFSINETTIYHELCHVIDKRLEWYATIYPDAAYSEEAWLALQPEGFRYAYSYTDLPADILSYGDSGYFLRDYAMTYPTEDRATLMAAAITQDERFEASAPMQAKMRFYAQCIRAAFQTEGWPETTAWERP
jgi:hypothetical protein